MKQSIIVFDVEASSTDPNTAIPTLMGFKSSNDSEFRYTTDIKEYVQILNSHDIWVGWNINGYDIPTLQRFGLRKWGHIIIDLMEIINGKGFGNDLGRKTIMQTPDGTHLGTVLFSKSMDACAEALGGPRKLSGDVDYAWFKQSFASLSPEIQKKAIAYLQRDIEMTEYIYEYVENFFNDFKNGGIEIDGEFKTFLTKEQVEKKLYLTASPAAFTYKALCNLAGIEEKYQNVEPQSYGGGFVSTPSQEKCVGDIYCLDYNCLPEGTQIRMWRKSNQYYDKSIEDLNVGDFVVNQDGKQEIGAINKQYYDGELIEFELENGLKVSCTPDHKFPLKSGEVKEAKDITEDDELLTTLSKIDIKNPNYKGKLFKICEVCGTEFTVFKSQSHIKTCCKDCANILRSRNSTKPNLGKTWDSKLKGIPRTQEVKDKISKATKEAMKEIDMSSINKNRNMDFMKSIEWHDKMRLSRLESVKNGKFAYNGINFRSNWEIIFAKNLDKNNIKWEYEPKVFELSNGSFYTPDFYLPEHDKWVEIKGYMYDHSKVKIQQFLDDGHELILLNDLNIINDEGVKWLK